MTAPSLTPAHRPNVTVPAQKRIIDALHETPGRWMLAAEVAAATGLSVVYANRHLSELVEAGIIAQDIDRAADNKNNKRKTYSCCGS